MKKFFKIILIVIAVFFAIGIIGAIFSDDETTTEESSTDVRTSNNWKYTSSINEMDGVETFNAVTKSTNKIEFDFPYSGGSDFNFIVYKSNGNYGFAMTVSSGQFMTSILGDECVRFKFDDGESIVVPYNSPTNAQFDIIYPEFSVELLAQLKTSEKLLIEAPFAMTDRKVIKFNIAGLDSNY